MICQKAIKIARVAKKIIFQISKVLESCKRASMQQSFCTEARLVDMDRFAERNKPRSLVPYDQMTMHAGGVGSTFEVLSHKDAQTLGDSINNPIKSSLSIVSATSKNDLLYDHSTPTSLHRLSSMKKLESFASRSQTSDNLTLTREERRKSRRATEKYRSAHASRERIRVEAFNLAFNRLRKLLPTLPPDKKLSKIEILRLAICYISYLNHVLQIS